MFEPAKDPDALLVRILVDDAGSQRLHITDRRNAGVDESRIRWVKTLFRG